MSRLAILAPLLLFSGMAVAQISAPDCSLSWQWTFNSLGQNACTVAAHLLATCSGGVFSLAPLEPGESYAGPSGVDDGDLCKCNTIAYSLLSACDACQQETWTTWSEFSSNCTKIMPVSSFPHPVPSGTRVPRWALLDVTPENNWNDNQSFAARNSPELTSGTVMSSTHSSSSNVGAIAGGVVGGVVAIAAAGLAIFFLRKMRRPQAGSAASVVKPPTGEVRPSALDDGKYVPSPMPGTLATMMKLYMRVSTPPSQCVDVPKPSLFSPPYVQGPSDSTLFPGFQGTDQVNEEVPVAPYSGNNLANMQTSRPQDYQGLPTV